MDNQANCRLIDKQLEKVLDLGLQPLGNGYIDPINKSKKEFFYKLECGFNEESSLFQILFQPKPEQMFNEEYAFFSSTSSFMRKHFEKLANDLINKYKLNPSRDFIVEIGSNDGVFLKHFQSRGFKHLGIEPSGKVAELAASEGISVMKDFFSFESVGKIISEYSKAKLISSSNVICHIPSVLDLSHAISKLLDNEGLFIFEDPYLGDVVLKNSFDQIYDEHVFLFSAIAVKKIFENVGLELINCERLSTHGGSMRFTIAHKGVYSINKSVDEVLNWEIKIGLNKTRTFLELSKRIMASKDSLLKQLEYLSSQKKLVVAYGATSKSTTIYNYVGIGPELIQSIYDNSPLKMGKLSPGVHIPIVTETEFKNSDADVTFLAAWNHANEIMRKNNDFKSKGGKWLTHVPEVRYFEN